MPVEIEDIAQLTRRHWGLGDGPIANMVALLETYGAVATRFSLGSARIDAFSCWISGKPYIVLGSDRKSAARSRFDAAHELGHLILHRDISQEDIQKKSVLDRIEQEANRFAGAFLFPRNSFLSEFYSTRMGHLAGLKRRWRVSIQAIAHRAKDLDAIDEYQYINFRKQISAQKMLVVETLDDVLPLENPSLLVKAWDLISQGGSASRVADTEFGLGADLVEELAAFLWILPLCLNHNCVGLDSAPHLSMECHLMRGMNKLPPSVFELSTVCSPDFPCNSSPAWWTRPSARLHSCRRMRARRARPSTTRRCSEFPPSGWPGWPSKTRTVRIRVALPSLSRRNAAQRLSGDVLLSIMHRLQFLTGMALVRHKDTTASRPGRRSVYSL